MTNVCLFFIFAGASTIRVTPISVKQATIVSSRWRIPGRQIGESVDSANVGCIAYLSDDTPHAIALLEIVENQIILWDIACDDFESGSKLIASICAQNRTKMYFSRALHPRWLIARDYFFIQRDETKGLPFSQ